MSLNPTFHPSQLQAITHKNGPCLVISGPGSGKTTVITQRIKYLTEQEAVSPEHLLVVTFTNAAAKEMRERFLKLIQRADTKVCFGTFHSVFYQILREYYGQKNFELINDSDRMKLIREVFREHFRNIEVDNELLSGILSEISASKNNGLSGTNQLKKSDTHMARTQFSLEKVIKYYDEKKKQYGKIDFDDMLILTAKLLKGNAKVRSLWQDRFTYICVDEFQDINPVQYEIIRILAAPENNLFIVGDDDQAIYKFRGSDPAIMLNFPKDYKNCEKIILAVNYRSTEAIIKSSLKVIRNNKNRFKKKLVSERDKGEKPVVREYKNEAEEGKAVAEDILDKINKGIPVKDIVILARTNERLDPVISALSEAKIPFQTKDRVRNIYRHFILKPVYALLNYAEGDRRRENFLKFMNCPFRYFEREDLIEDTVDLTKLIQRFQKSYDRRFMAERAGYLSYQLSLLEKMSLPFVRINYIRKFMQYDRYVKDYAEQRQMSPEGFLLVLDEIQEDAIPYQTVKEWYDHITSVTLELDKMKKEGYKEEKDKLLLSTFHSSKGLEYKNVYIIGANEKVTPHEKAVRNDEIEEERRMFYVAMTRAAEKLYISYTRERYGKKAEISRFVKEMQELL